MEGPSFETAKKEPIGDKSTAFKKEPTPGKKVLFDGMMRTYTPKEAKEIEQKSKEDPTFRLEQE